MTGIALALSLGGGALMAQAPGHGQHRTAEQGEVGPGGRRGPEAFLLRGITLSTDQQARVAKLSEKFQKERAEHGEARRKEAADGAARQRPDSAQRAARRDAMMKERDKHIAELREILTPDQQRQFDTNVAAMKQRMEQRMQHGQQRGQR